MLRIYCISERHLEVQTLCTPPKVNCFSFEVLYEIVALLKIRQRFFSLGFFNVAIKILTIKK